MGVGSVMFSIPHFSGETNAGILVDNKTDDNICRLVSVRESDMGLGRFGQHISKLSNPALGGTPNNLRFVHVSLPGFWHCGHQLLFSSFTFRRHFETKFFLKHFYIVSCRGNNCLESKSSTFGPVLLFVIAQLLLGAGGSPLLTLGEFVFVLANLFKFSLLYSISHQAQPTLMITSRRRALPCISVRERERERQLII